VELISRFLGSDFLSPLVAGFLFLDVPRQVLGPFWFGARRDSLFEKSVADRWKLVGQTDFFYRPIFGLCMKGFLRPPAVFFNATDADSGAYVPLSETTLTYPDFRVTVHQQSDIETSLNRSSIVNITVAQATHISALFPYLSDALEVRLSRTASKLLQDRLVLYDYYHDGDMNHGNVDELKNRAASEEVDILADGRSRHLASLVDGGYFDNTGLLPTEEALNFINGRRDEEDKVAGRSHGHYHPRPYSDKRIMIVHFSNDPSFACLPLDDDWVAKANRKTRAVFDPTSMLLGCEEDSKAIQNSVAANVASWLQAPISAMLSVRDSHSLNERQSLMYRFSNATKETAFVSLDLATAMTEAYGKPDTYSTLNPVYPSSLFDLSPERWQAIESSVQSRSRGVDANHSGIYVAAPADQFGVDMWINRSHDWISRLDCLQSLGMVDPPLGWTLNGRDKSALQCLMQMAIFRSGVVNLSEPYGTAPPKLPDSEEQPDYVADFANLISALGANSVGPTPAMIQYETAEEAQQARRAALPKDK
jgi:hypothetical protein